MSTKLFNIPLAPTKPTAHLSEPRVVADTALDVVMAYHERSKHYPHRFAASLGYMDWATQPDPFRRYLGAELLALPLLDGNGSVAYADLYVSGRIEPAPLSLDSISRFFRYSLSLTAWKRVGSKQWALRANPSSGNLHPTEAYALLPALEGLHEQPALYHYTALEHALERRAILDAGILREVTAAWPQGSFVVGLSAIHWREAWKYGERAFRYCQHDIGHALAALRMAAASLGWKLECLDDVSSSAIAELLGLDRDDDFWGAEREEPELLALVFPGAVTTSDERRLVKRRNKLASAWFGRANALSVNHAADWPVIEQVAEATRRIEPSSIHEKPEVLGTDEDLDVARPVSEGFSAETEQTLVEAERSTAESVLLGRRSATAMDGKTTIPQATFFRTLARLTPPQGVSQAPWDAVAWRPRIHLGLFVHRVEGLPRGLYVVLRDPWQFRSVKAAMGRDFVWQRVPQCSKLPLYLLETGDFRQLSSALSCGQAIAGDGAFSVAMLADYRRTLKQQGAFEYRRLYWEAGMIGQVLYLEAQAAGLGGTGIGCYFDDQVHELFGLTSPDWQSLYHFTVGGPLDDPRLSTLPAYG